MFSALDPLYRDYALESRIPGLIHGVVTDRRLVHVRGFGVRDLSTGHPVTPTTLFRIASLTKAFTALTVLRLRDEGKLMLDAPAESYIPELRHWDYPSGDSARIRVRDLLSHTAGFVWDDPWADRQTLIPEADFARLLREGILFARSPVTAPEYSNLGYALLGRIIGKVSGQPYDMTIGHTILEPLGMTSTGFTGETAPGEDRAIGYSWVDEGWHVEPPIPHGSFGAMGGLHSTAEDYAKWVAYLLSAWPPRDDEDDGPVPRASVRDLAAQGSSLPEMRRRYGRTRASPGEQSVTYGMGMIVSIDKELGFTLSHTGGYPGFGSHVLLLPNHGIGLFAFANRTYADVAQPVWDAALALREGGHLADRALAISEPLAVAYQAAKAIYTEGDLSAAGDLLAVNFLMDRDAAGWRRDLANLKEQVGECVTAGPVAATSCLSGRFLWICERGEITGSLFLTPTRRICIQQLVLARKAS